MGKNFLGAALLILAAIIIAFFFWQLSSNNIEFKTVVSGSMSPSINAGDVVAISKINTSTLEVGDIITFGSANTYTTHRIVNITAEGFVTKGDANEDPDMGIITTKEVAGKVVFTIPYLGYLGSFVRTPIGFAIFILIPGALIIISEVLKIKKEHDREKPPKLRYLAKENKLKLCTHPDAHSINNAKWVEKKIDHSRYESLQEELERDEG